MEPTRSAKAKDFLAKVLPAGLESLPGPGDAMESLAPQARPAGPLEAAVESASRKLQTGEALAPPEQFALEAIIIPDKRPAIDVVDGDFQVTHPLWLHLNADPARANLRRALPSIGRIELPGHPTLPYGGTGFVVGRDLLMTNRHVAEIFTNGLGMRDLVFRQGLSAGIDFVRERGSPPEGRVLAVRHVEMIHPYWDMALLRVEGLDSTHAPLKLSLLQPEALAGRDVAVIGYPAFDPRNAADVQNTVFGGVYYVKRMQPGKLNGRGAIDSFGKSVAAATHDSSTLGGNSGSAVVDVATGQVVGLHFAGVYLQSNYAVPTAELARDGRVDGFDLAFEGEPRPEAGLWSSWWDPTESGPAGAPAGIQTAAAPSATASALSPPQAAPAASVVSPVHPAELRWTVPIEITVRVGEGQASAAVSSAASAPAVEAMVEPAHDTDYDDRKGYDPDFLGVAAPLPEATDPAMLSRPSGGGLLLRYRHFSVALHKGRRLALFTASNIDLSPAMRQAPDGGSLTRKALSGLGDHDMEKWFLDPRAPAADQLPDRFFTKDKGAFDKGHIVRREDVAWGTNFDEIRSANGDTFHVTNCSPQVAGYNRPKQATNWGDLEQYVSKQAGGGRLSLFAGPVLADDDPFFAGVDDSGRTRVRIPRRFWKVVLARSGAALQAFAFVLEQDLADTPLEFAVEEKWRHALLSIAELERELRLVRFPPAIHAADQAGGPAGAAVAKLAGSRRRAAQRRPTGRGGREAAVEAPPPRDAGPQTFRDHFLSLYQSAAAEIAREEQAGGAGIEMVAAPPSGSDPVAAAQQVAAARYAEAPDPARTDESGPGLERLSAVDRGLVCASLALQLLEARLSGDATTADRIEGELADGECDVRWARVIKEYVRYFGPGGTRREPIYTTPAQAGEGAIPMKPDLRVALVGDWGTGAGPARRILRLIRDEKPDALIHLGDIYYSGTPAECRDNFEAIVAETFGPAGARLPVFTLCGNHDMYCGGEGYYGLISRLNPEPTRQRASFFCLRAQDASWQLLAMDTGRHDYKPLSVSDAVTFVEPEEQAWLERRVTEFPGRTVLLSHHQLFSAFSAIGKPGAGPTNPKLLDLFHRLTATGRPIPAWFWGHEHNLCVYEPFAGLERGRCLGHGAVPVLAGDDPYERVAGLAGGPQIEAEAKLSVSGAVWTHGFAMLTLAAGGGMKADYIEDKNGAARQLWSETF